VLSPSAAMSATFHCTPAPSASNEACDLCRLSCDRFYRMGYVESSGGELFNDVEQ
jgi:hypothetical protein